MSSEDEIRWPDLRLRLNEPSVAYPIRGLFIALRINFRIIILICFYKKHKLPILQLLNILEIIEDRMNRI